MPMVVGPVVLEVAVGEPAFGFITLSGAETVSVDEDDEEGVAGGAGAVG